MVRYLSLLFLFLLIATSELAAQEVEKGVIDLSDVDLKGNSFELSGEWEFYWSKLVDPSVIDRLEKDFYPLPSVWNGGKTWGGIPLKPMGYATYRVQVVLPKERPELSLTINEIYSSSLVFYNGFEFVSNGEVSTNSYDAIPDWLPKTTNFRPYSDTIEFVLQVSNYHHYLGGVNEPIVIGDREVLTSKRDFNFSYDFLLCGSLIMGGLFFLGLFLFGQHERSVLYFALFCITFSYHLIGGGDYALHALFPNMSWFLLIRLEFLSLFVPAGIFSLYTCLLYPKDANQYILYAFAIVSGFFALMAIFTSTAFFTQLVEPFVILMVLMILYMGYVYWIAFRRNRLGSQYALWSTGIIFIVVIYQVVVRMMGIEENTFLSFIGFIFFFFFQSLILSYRFAASLRLAKDAAVSASQAKTDFLSTISHEIRTPLNAVVGISHYLINEDPKPEQIESLESLQFSAEQLTLLINDILDYSKLESGSIEFDYAEINIHSLCEKIIGSHASIASEKGIALSLEFDPNIYPHILADATRLYQVLNNLLSNAVKFTSKGFVKMRLIKTNEDEDFQTIQFKVQDTGVGIPLEKREIIFERFTQAGSSTTREYGGTGLGLAIIKRILTLFESEIHLESEEGKGSVFSFELEFKKIKSIVKNKKPLSENQPNDLAGRRILLVEDNRMNIMVAEKFLKKWELEIDIAMNGEEAVNCVKNNNYDLVLMDLQMPLMDGYDATRAIRVFNKELPIIALTASALLKVQQEVKAAGMNDYLTKPFDPEDLRKKLLEFIDL